MNKKQSTKKTESDVSTTTRSTQSSLDKYNNSARASTSRLDYKAMFTNLSRFNHSARQPHIQDFGQFHLPPLPVSLIASGPSLIDCMDDLRSVPTTTITAPTALEYLLNCEIPVDAVTIVDPNPVGGRILRGLNYVGPILASPIAGFDPRDSNAVYSWKPYLENLGANPEYTMFNQAIDGLCPFFDTWILQAGCVFNSMVLLICEYARARNFGSPLIHAYGADFCFASGPAPTCHRVPISPAPGYEDDPHPFTTEADLNPIQVTFNHDGHEHTYSTTPTLRSYAVNLAKIIHTTGVEIEFHGRSLMNEFLDHHARDPEHSLIHFIGDLYAE